MIIFLQISNIGDDWNKGRVGRKREGDIEKGTKGKEEKGLRKNKDWTIEAGVVNLNTHAVKCCTDD